MADDMRMGLELELHGIVLTFKRKGTKELWPAALPSSFKDGTNAILVPKDPTFLTDGRTNWESDWGFRAVGDRHGPGTVFGEVTPTIVLELATAANTVRAATYWSLVRLCAQQFIAAMETFKPPGKWYNVFDNGIDDGQARWYPLVDLKNLYNDKIESLEPREGFNKSKFKLDLSSDVASLAAGTFPGLLGEIWEAIFSVNHPLVDQKSPPFSYIQINYQVDLEWLDQCSEDWIGLWDSMWANKVMPNAPELDPNIGLSQITPLSEVWRTQLFAALWRAAKAQAVTMVESANVPAVPAAALPMVRGLVTYLLAAGSISVQEAGGSTSKNSFPQLPKTSPASIARLIGVIHPEAKNALRHLATDPGTIQRVNDAIAFFRVRANLVGVPGKLSPLSPQIQIRAATYPDCPDGMLGQGPDPQSTRAPNFDQMWAASLDPEGPDISMPGKKSGFTPEAPFYCAWAGGVHTSYPAARHGDGIKMLFESRYGTDKLNIGFNPYVRDFAFNRAYLSMVRQLAPAPENVATATAIVSKLFPDEPDVQQIIPDGCGEH